MDALSIEDNEYICCPACHARHLPAQTGLCISGLFTATCQSCETLFKFRAAPTPLSHITLTVNGVEHTVGNEYLATTTLNEYIRETLHLHGTKVMCREGGCGCCTVAVTYDDPLVGSQVTTSLNSCLYPLYGCEGWQVTTTEGLGGHKAPSGFHPIQERLAEYNGSQCGMCTPGMVISTYSMLQKSCKPSKADMESGLDGNICRCTGYRSLLDAIKSLADTDIEDLKLCKQRGQLGCHISSLSNVTNPSQCSTPKPLLLSLQGAMWYRPTDLCTVYKLLEQSEPGKVKMVVGNTGGEGKYDCYIDTKAVQDLYTYKFEDGKSVTFGANWSLTHLIAKLGQISTSRGFGYCTDMMKHLQKVANHPVRNVGCWAGNLMLKHGSPSFPSDLAVLLEAVGAYITIGSTSSSEHYTVSQFLKVNMDRKVILSMTLLPLGSRDYFRSFKVMPRSQSSLAHVIAAFRLQLEESDKYRVIATPAIVYGNISGTFLHAEKTEGFLRGKQLADPVVFKDALDILQSEVLPAESPSTASALYRQKLALALFYKFVLRLLGDDVPSPLRSGGTDLERPLSGGKQTYDTDRSKWPLTEPMTKKTAKLQASGEAEYVGDLPVLPGQLYGAFVTTTVGNATIDHIDAAEALAAKGVVKFLTLGDIPAGGVNNIAQPGQTEELFCSGSVLYAGQAVGLLVAESQSLADQAARLVKVTYKDVKPALTDTREAIKEGSFFPKPFDDLVDGNAEEAIAKSAHKIDGEIYCGDQYHFTLETQSCVCIPKEDEMEVFPSTQWIDAAQSSIGQVLNMPENKIHAQVKRLGGAYGSKITRNWPVSAACALAAYTLNRPVRIVMSLQSNMAMLGKRFPTVARYQVGVTDEGQLNGVKVTYFQDCGCSPNDIFGSSIFTFADSAYYSPTWHMAVEIVKTNKPMNTACRSPGSLPTIFVMETILEHVARELGRDPAEVKKLNLYQNGQVTPTGTSLTYCNIRELVEALEKSACMQRRQYEIEAFNKANRWKKKGLGFQPMKFPALYTGTGYNVLLAIYGTDGSVSITHGGVEVGQGINTKVMQVCAYELAIPLSMVHIRGSESHSNANSTTTGGSVTSELCCRGVIECCSSLKQRMAPVKAKMKDPTWQQLVQRCLQEGIDLSARYWHHVSAEETRPFYNTYGVTLSEVELDVLTGENIIQRSDILYDCGDSMNPELDVGQVEGAHVMGLGYCFLEEIKYDPVTGQNLSTSTWNYKPPTSKDIPVDFRVELLKNVPNPLGVLGSKMVGEPPLVMACASLFGLKRAIEAARADTGNTKYFPLDIPATVERAQLSSQLDISRFVITE